MWTRAVRLIRFASIQEVLHHWRIYDESLTRRSIETINRQDQDIRARMLKELDIEYAKDEYLLCTWPGFLHRYEKSRWREKLGALKELLTEIISQNDRLRVYDTEAMRRAATRQYMFSLDLDDAYQEEDFMLPFEAIMDELLHYAEQKAGNRNICIFGLGRYGKQALPHYKKCFGARLVCVSDNDPNKWGKLFEGIECIPPDELNNELHVIIAAGYDGIIEISDKLFKRGHKNFMSFVPPLQ
jgi:hypothetical protein